MDFIRTISTQLLPDQQQKLEQVYKRLVSIRCTESAFTEIELLFLDVLSVFRNSSSAPFDVFERLQSIQNKEYKFAQNTQLTIKNRVLAIKRFKNSFRLAVRLAIKTR
jgi:hypothetical protein